MHTQKLSKLHAVLKASYSGSEKFIKHNIRFSRLKNVASIKIFFIKSLLKEILDEAKCINTKCKKCPSLTKISLDYVGLVPQSSNN